MSCSKTKDDRTLVLEQLARQDKKTKKVQSAEHPRHAAHQLKTLSSCFSFHASFHSSIDQLKALQRI
ncbi:hypothetical protein D4R54_02165 [archaeon]|nr:MAG: hypothetical protein D4R54_02165 [archaeon]